MSVVGPGLRKPLNMAWLAGRICSEHDAEVCRAMLVHGAQSTCRQRRSGR